MARFTDVKFATFTARNAVNDVGGVACKIVPNNEIAFRSGNRCARVEERTRVTTSTRARKGGAVRFCLRALCTKVSRMFLLRLKEIRGLSVKMADVSGSFLRICAISPISGGNDSRKRHEKRLIFKIRTIHPHGFNERFSFS